MATAGCLPTSFKKALQKPMGYITDTSSIFYSPCLFPVKLTLCFLDACCRYWTVLQASSSNVGKGCRNLFSNQRFSANYI